MKYQATPKSALLTGAWSSFGFCSVENFLSDLDAGVIAHNVVFIALFIIFFFVPILFFVVGKEYIKVSFKYSFSNAFVSVLPDIFGRMACWFLAAVIFGVGYFYILYSLMLD